MDNNPQPSFIPKKQMSQPAPGTQKSSSLFSVIATLIFIISIILGGAVFGFEQYFSKQLEKKQQDLQIELAKFGDELVSDLSRLDNRIESVKTLMRKHISPALFFKVLSNATLKTIRFTDFAYTTAPGQGLIVTMNGQSKNFASVALQQAEFMKPENNKYFKTPLISDMNLDTKGNVTFKFSSALGMDLLAYGLDIKPSSSSASTTGTSTLKVATSTSTTATTTSKTATSTSKTKK